LIASTPAASPGSIPGATTGRVLVIDWLRGVAVVLMILAHSFDAWMDPAERHGPGWFLIRHASGIPSRLFLFLVGVSSAIVFERQIAHGKSSREMWRTTARRGLLVLVLAYLFRLQEHVLAGFWGGWVQVLRVDILNCIGASLLLVAALGTPRAGRPRMILPLVAAAVLVALGPIVGPSDPLPSWVPRAISSYVGGKRPMSWFPLFPWGAWALLGLVVGHLWLRRGRDPASQARVFLTTGAIGALLIASVTLVRWLAPDLIRYPSELVQQMGPGSFLFRLGLIGLLACLGWLATRSSTADNTPLRQVGRTSLLIYWVHVEICYGFGTRPLQKQLSLPAAAVAFVLLCIAMWGLSVLKTRHGPRLLGRLRARFARAAR
jgi:uncharacterized membrane protein